MTDVITFRDGSQNRMTFISGSNDVTELILVLPAMGVRASYYEEFAKELTTTHREVVLIDLRGQGYSSVRASRSVDWGYLDHVNDIHETVQFLKSRYKAAKMYVLGHSLGGQMACLFSAKYPNQINGLILIATCSVYYKGWKGWRRFQTYFAVKVFSLINTVMGYFPGHKIGFGGKEGKTEMSDWCHNAITGEYVLSNDSFDYEKGLSECENRIFAISIEGDNYAPYRATKNLLQKFSPASHIEHITVKDKVRMNHFNWTKSTSLFKDLIHKWIDIDRMKIN